MSCYTFLNVRSRIEELWIEISQEGAVLFYRRSHWMLCPTFPLMDWTAMTNLIKDLIIPAKIVQELISFFSAIIPDGYGEWPFAGYHHYFISYPTKWYCFSQCKQGWIHFHQARADGRRAHDGRTFLLLELSIQVREQVDIAGRGLAPIQFVIHSFWC